MGDWVAYSTIPSDADRAYIRAGLAARSGLGEKLGIPTYAAETGRVLVWDYRVGTWFVRNYQDQPIYSMALEDGDAGEGGSGRVVLGIYNDADAITLWREDAGWDDADAGHVATVLETGDIRLKGSQGGAMQAEALGLQRIRAINVYGTVRGGPELLCAESVDGGQTYESKDAVALTNSENWTYRYQTKRLRAQQHRLRLTEEAGATNDCEGVAYAMLSLDCNPASGLARTLPTDRG
jgi:hypothetical protein